MVSYHVEGIISTDGKGCIVQMNNDASNLTGWLNAEVKGKMLGEVFYIIDKVSGKQIDLFSDSNLVDADIVNHPICVNLISRDDNEKTISLKYIPVKVEGKLISAVIIFHEIIEEKEGSNSDFEILSKLYINKDLGLAEKIRRFEHLFKAIFENDTDFVALIDAQGKVIFDSSSQSNVLGYSSEEIIEKNTFDMVHPEDKDKAIELFNEILKEKGTLLFPPVRVIHADGYWIWVEGVANNLLDDPEINAIILNFRDITKRIEAEQALNYSQELLKYIIENSNSAIAVHDKELRYIYVSRNYLEQYKVKETDIIGKSHYDVFPNLPQKWREVHQKALKGEISNSEMDSYTNEDGSEEWTKWECRPWYEVDHSVGGIIVYTQVITEQVRREEELKRERLLLRTLIDNLPVSIYIKDSLGRKVIANQTDVLLIGCKDESEIIGKTDLEIFEGEVGIRGYDDDMKVINSGSPIINKEEYFLNKDGSKRWSIASKFPLKDKNGKVTGLVGIGRDINQPKERP